VLLGGLISYKYTIHEWDSYKINGMFSCWVTDIENKLKIDWSE